MLSNCFGFVQLIMPCYCSVSVQLEMDDETELMTFEEQLAQLNATRLKEDKHTVPENFRQWSVRVQDGETIFSEGFKWNGDLLE